jgi:hypothetical protein
VRRREFITLLGGATAWPLVAHAQQGERVRRIGMLMNTAADDTVFQIRLGAFLQGLAVLGWTIGRNLRIEIRWSGGKADAARRYAAELVAFAPDVILAHGVSTVRPLLQATRTRSGRLASSPAIEWRVHCGIAARLSTRRSSGNCQGAQEPTRSLLQAVDIVVPSGCESRTFRNHQGDVGRGNRERD